MATEFSFNFPLAEGLHARPASAFEIAARPFASEITIINDRTGARASVKSVLALVSTITLPGDPCRLHFQGCDEARAREALSRFVVEKLPHCDDPPPEPPVVAGEIHLPHSLRNTGAVFWKAKSAVPGIGVGRLVRLPDVVDPSNGGAPNSIDASTEKERLLNALQTLDRAYAERIKKTTDKLALGLLQAHRMMAGDPALNAWMLGAIENRRLSAIQAVSSARDHFAGVFTASASVLLRERALDVRDVCGQLARELEGLPPGAALVLTHDSILVAEGLTPSELLALDRRFLKGLALAKTGGTSHAVVLARSFGIPCVIEVSGFSFGSWEGQEAIVDGELGLLVAGLTPPARRYYEMEQWRLQARHARVQRLAALPGQTADGARLEIAANISSPDEAATAIAAGAEAIGLFRTEMLFMDRGEAPGEEEQREAYARALRDAAGRMVIIRTLDIGGDKPVGWLHLPAEDNPMLGVRGARLYPRIETLIRTQIRALLRASANGQLRVLVPMMTSIGEARRIKRIFAEERAKLAEAGTCVGNVPLGAMIEIPAAAFDLAALSREMDFFSIGSNDLVHYFTATDRGASNPLDDPLAPSFLRLLKKIVDDAHAAGRWIGLCGEMGSSVQCLPLFVGLGLDEISMPIESLAPIKDRLAPLLASECRRLLTDALDCVTAEEVRGLLRHREPCRALPLLTEELVVLDSPATTRAEAIKTLCDILYATGRTDNSRQIEEAIWKRDGVHSTGFGHCFAIPHCKNGAVASDSLCILRPRSPIPWGNSSAGVDLVVLLTIRQNDKTADYLKIISLLAGLFMDKSFRDNLASIKTSAAMTEFLTTQMETPAPSPREIT